MTTPVPTGPEPMLMTISTASSTISNTSLAPVPGMPPITLKAGNTYWVDALMVATPGTTLGPIPVLSFLFNPAPAAFEVHGKQFTSATPSGTMGTGNAGRINFGNPSFTGMAISVANQLNFFNFSGYVRAPDGDITATVQAATASTPGVLYYLGPVLMRAIARG